MYDIHVWNSDTTTFHGLVVAHVLPDESLAFGQVKNSLLGTSLSGNWIFSKDDSDGISSVCRSHILIATEEVLGIIENVSSQSIFYGDFNELVSSIQSLERDLKESWEKHLLENPKKTKTLVEPNWSKWMNVLEISNPIESLTQSGKSAHPDSTPDDMKSLIALGRMARHVLDNWRELEENRVAKKFLKLSQVEPRIWPPNWVISERETK
jgi:hypothetical protein